MRTRTRPRCCGRRSRTCSQLKSATVDLKVTADGRQRRSCTGAVRARRGAGRAAEVRASPRRSSRARARDRRRDLDRRAGYATLDGIAYEIPSLFVQQLGAGFEQAAPLLPDVSKWVAQPAQRGPGRRRRRGDGQGHRRRRRRRGHRRRRAAQRVARLAEAARRQALARSPRGPPRARRGKDAKVEVYTGAADSMLRRLVVTRDDRRTSRSSLDLTLTKVGEDAVDR